MQQLLRETGALISWYKDHVRSVVNELASDRVADFDAQADHLARIAQLADTEVAACFLGQSGVGKSTLINALVGHSQVILPAGGVGPLTAQAIEVRYSERPIFTVEYHRRQQFWQLVFALEQQLVRQNAAQVDGDLELEVASEEELAVENNSQVTDHFERQARLIVRGDQNAQLELRYLVDCLRLAGGKPARWGSAASTEDTTRIERVSRALLLASKNIPHSVDAASSDGTFMQELRMHAAGFLSPLIRQIELGWPAEILSQGLRVVDLPGVGISSDAYRVVTERPSVPTSLRQF